MTIILTTIKGISILCLLFVGTLETRVLFTALFFENTSIILYLTIACNIIPKSFDQLLHKVVTHLSELMPKNTQQYANNHRNNDNSIVMNLNYIKTEMGFTALGIYKIDIKTFISLISLILSYSVILIQTNSM